MLVQDIMSRDLALAVATTPVTDIARAMVDRQISEVPVIDEAGQLIGMVTTGDMIARNAHLHFPRYIKFLDSVIYLESTAEYDEEVRKVLATTASEIMSDPEYVVAPDTDVADAATTMFEQGLNALAVVDGGRLAGLVSRFDLVRLMVRDEAIATGTPDPSA